MLLKYVFCSFSFGLLIHDWIFIMKGQNIRSCLSNSTVHHDKFNRDSSISWNELYNNLSLLDGLPTHRFE